MAGMMDAGRATGSLYVQYGSGPCVTNGWLNFDASVRLWPKRIPFSGRLITPRVSRFPATVRYGDVARGLPLSDRSCAAVYASHVLEHLALDDFHRALDETYRILRPAGVFRAVVPDLEGLARAYLRRLDDGDTDANGWIMRASGLGRDQRRRGAGGFLKTWLGTNQHFWMWDYLSLASALEDHGFVGVRRAAFGDAADPVFRAVEDPERFEDAVAIEARRPA